MDTVKIGQYIARKRKEVHLTQKQLAEMLNVTDKTVSRWETGRYMPDMSLLVPLSDILKVSLFELMMGEDSNKSEFEYTRNENGDIVFDLSELTDKEQGMELEVVQEGNKLLIRHRKKVEKDSTSERDKVDAAFHYMNSVRLTEHKKIRKTILIGLLPMIISGIVFAIGIYDFNVMLEIYHRMVLQLYWLVIMVICIIRLYKTGDKVYGIYMNAALIAEVIWLWLQGHFNGFMIKIMEKLPILACFSSIMLMVVMAVIWIFLLYYFIRNFRQKKGIRKSLVMAAALVALTAAWIYLFTTPEGAVRAYFISKGHFIAAFKKVVLYELNGKTRVRSVKAFKAVFHSVVQYGELEIVKLGIIILAKYYGFG